MNVAHIGGRNGAVAAFANGRLLVFGGLTATNEVAPVEEYDPAANQWTQRGSMPQGLSPSTAVVVGSVIYLNGIVGGAIARFDAQQRVWLDQEIRLPDWSERALLEDGGGGILSFHSSTSYMGRPIYRYLPATAEWSFRGLIPPRYPIGSVVALRLGTTAYLVSPNLSVLTLDLSSFQELRFKRE